ncbi:MAG: hypothetical protein ACYDER_11920 [Ktedonobacteraceae bacterium]
MEYRVEYGLAHCYARARGRDKSGPYALLRVGQTRACGAETYIAVGDVGARFIAPPGTSVAMCQSVCTSHVMHHDRIEQEYIHDAHFRQYSPEHVECFARDVAGDGPGRFLRRLFQPARLAAH